MRRLLTLLAILGAAAPVALFVLQDDDGALAASTHLEHAAGAAPPAVLPPSGSVVLARESRGLTVALAVRPGMPLRLTATIIGGEGGGVDGLDVELIAGKATSGASNSARPCGQGCYTTTLPVRAPTRFAVNIAGAGPFRSVAFPLPGRWAPEPGAAFLSRATRAFRALRSVLFVERLSSGRRHTIVTTWKLETPNKLEYSIRGGAGGIVIGGKRWDRAKTGAPWEESTSTLLPQPLPPWGTRVANAFVLRRTPRRVTLSWFDPSVPSWFTGTFDRATARPVEVRMMATAHFMQHRYLAFNRDVRILPPT
ncbi:MAG: hypothetical protein ABI717_05675 [Actinomycetota bacterium]